LSGGLRWSARRDGAVAIYDDTDITDDLMVVEPVITAFTPSHDGRCNCGGVFGFRCAIDGTSEIYCFRCHVALARISLGTRVHR
jgi:hypothetical protein